MKLCLFSAACLNSCGLGGARECSSLDCVCCWGWGWCVSHDRSTFNQPRKTWQGKISRTGIYAIAKMPAACVVKGSWDVQCGVQSYAIIPQCCEGIVGCSMRSAILRYDTSVLWRDCGMFNAECNPTLWYLSVVKGLWDVQCGVQSYAMIPQEKTICRAITIVTIIKSFWMKETDSQSGWLWRIVRPRVSLNNTRKTTLCKPSGENVKPLYQDLNQRPAYRADLLTAAPWCCSHPQRRRHGISPTSRWRAC